MYCHDFHFVKGFRKGDFCIAKQAKEMAKFILNDETRKNAHGFYLVNAGGRFERFNENPVMLNMHDLNQLIGKWLNLRTEGSLLIADPEFDEGDTDALKIKGKVDRGYLKGASVGIIINAAEWRTNPETKVEELYVTDWELFEVSIVSVPSNAGALTLKVYDGQCRLMSDETVRPHIENIIRLSLSEKEIQPTKKDVKMDGIKLTVEAIVALGIQEGADSAAICMAILALKKKADDAAADLKVEKEKNEATLKKQAEDLVNLAVTAGKIPADKKDQFVKLALADYDTAKAALDAIPEKKSLSAQIKGVVGAGTDIPAGRENWTLLQWMKDDMAGLNKLKAEQPEVYEEIKKRK